MDKIVSLIDKLRSARAELLDIAVEVIDDSEEEIITLNQDQLFAGETADGKEISPQYTPFTIAIKKRKGQPFDRVTLLDTGSFYGKMKIKTIGQILDISSDDPKTPLLLKKYGEEIFGLTEENRIDLENIILKPRFEEKLKFKLELQ